MKIKDTKEAYDAMVAIGIDEAYATQLRGQSGKRTGRNGTHWTQLMFNAEILALPHDFCFCIPNNALENEDDAK